MNEIWVLLKNLFIKSLQLLDDLNWYTCSLRGLIFGTLYNSISVFLRIIISIFYIILYFILISNNFFFLGRIIKATTLNGNTCENPINKSNKTVWDNIQHVWNYISTLALKKHWYYTMKSNHIITSNDEY